MRNPACVIEHEGDCPEPYQLWAKAQETMREEHQRLMRDHGHIVKTDVPDTYNMYEDFPQPSPDREAGLREALIACLRDFDQDPPDAFVDQWLPRFAALLASDKPGLDGRAGQAKGRQR